jgi:phage head maturation protease
VITINTSTLDRYGTVIEPDGVNMDNYRKNPVFLINHDPNLLAGSGANVRMQGGKLIAEVDDDNWDQDDPQIKRWYNKVKNGTMRASSIQFLPLEWNEEEDEDNGRFMRITNWELLEWSFVTLPGNPDAVRTARSFSELAGINLKKEITDLRELLTGEEYIDRVAERILTIWTPPASKGSVRKAVKDELTAPEAPERKATEAEINQLIAKALGKK